MSIGKTRVIGVRRQTRKSTDIRCVGTDLYLLPVIARVPLKFGAETLTSVTCARVQLHVVGRNGRRAVGWGETPLNVQWTWPGDLGYTDRQDAMVKFCRTMAEIWADFDIWGHSLELGSTFQSHLLPNLLDEFNRERSSDAQLPYLAALVCCSPFDIALHDAYGRLNEVPTYATYGPQYMNSDLADLFDDGQSVGNFRGKYPADYLETQPPSTLPAWHLVGGLDPLDASELEGDEPDDGYPVVLADWIKRDGLTCLKVKLRGDDPEWDYERLFRVGAIGRSHGITHLTADFNCTVRDPAYVIAILDRLERDDPKTYAMIKFVEQPFPYELEKFQIDVRSISRRKPLLLDESAHDWRHVRRGAELGWNGVALKTCKTQTGVLMSLCWARAHQMRLMVQDLTNPMLAQIPHVLLAAHAATDWGVESNSMQFYPDASLFEATVHPGLYTRRNGILDLSTIGGHGFGYRVEEIRRPLFEPVVSCGQVDGYASAGGPHILGKNVNLPRAGL